VLVGASLEIDNFDTSGYYIVRFLVFLAFTGTALANDSCEGLRALPKQSLNHDLRLDLTKDCFCPDSDEDCLSHLEQFITMCDLDYHCVRRYRVELRKAVRRAAYCRMYECAKKSQSGD
jgi:hypothetical protein